MVKRDGREISRQNQLRILKMLHKFGFLRTRDLAALCWMPSRSAPPKGDFTIQPIHVSSSAVRMAQKTLKRLNEDHLVFSHTAPDNSLIYGLSESGSRLLQGYGIPSKSAADWLRRFSPQQYHHRRISNEVAICGMLQGYRVSTEREIACGHWLGGIDGIHGKKPDVVIRNGKSVYFVEAERSRKTVAEYKKLLLVLQKFWQGQQGQPAHLPGEYRLEKVLFIANRTFGDRLNSDLKNLGWTDAQIKLRIQHVSCLYVTEAKYLMKI